MFKSFIKRKLTAYVHDVVTPDVVAAVTSRMLNERCRERLLDAVLHDDTPGVVTAAEGQTPLIVSLTTHGNRLHEVCLAIESIMQGTLKPNGIVLWLDEADTRPLPISLQRQQRRGLQVVPTRDIRSFTKLLPALRRFPQADIVTIDDDVFYPHDCLERLVATHVQHPDAIVANMVMAMSRDGDGMPQGILRWPYVASDSDADVAGADFFFEGFAGVLYPKCVMPEETFDEETFMSLCPTADDIWFNAMARLRHTPVRVCPRGDYDFIGAVNQACQATALNLINNSGHLADVNLRAVWERYHLQGR